MYSNFESMFAGSWVRLHTTRQSTQHGTQFVSMASAWVGTRRNGAKNSLQKKQGGCARQRSHAVRSGRDGGVRGFPVRVVPARGRRPHVAPPGVHACRSPDPRLPSGPLYSLLRRWTGLFTLSEGRYVCLYGVGEVGATDSGHYTKEMFSRRYESCGNCASKV